MTCQTAPRYTMDKTTQKSATSTKDDSCMATQWSMYDEYRTLNASDEKKREYQLPQRQHKHLEGKYYVGELRTNDLQQQQQQEERVEVGGARGVEVGGARGVEVGGLLRGLGWVERQLSSSVNLHLLHAYTDYAHQRKEGPKSGAEACESGGCQAEELWHFRCEATSGCRVNGITFCSSSPWLVVAAYGSPSLTNHSGGALCGWSAKRIGQPEVRANKGFGLMGPVNFR
ncbi:uncharacterized protein [Procambarus clarkii]|uniref:uncharacterized protein n=1 Tax=Procambarus clarkii TaxID=6728 RepID=UPI003742C12B